VVSPLAGPQRDKIIAHPMRTICSIVAGVLLLAESVAFAQAVPPAGMALPVPAAELAAAAGLSRSDPATLPVDLVRALYASPERATDQETTRAAVRRLLESPPQGSDRFPLPLTAPIWRERLLQENVPDQRLASAILGRRTPALIYYALLGVDDETQRWFGQNPSALEHLRKHPGAAAAFARSVHVRQGRMLTPGEDADAVWASLAGVEPSHPDSFIAHLLDARAGRLAFLFDAVTHLDAAHQRFALGAGRGEARIGRARALFDAVAEASPSWRIEERPFARPDVDVALALRLVAVTDTGAIRGLASRDIWDRVFGDRAEAGADGPSIDAAWLAARLLRPPAVMARERLDVFLFAQRVLQDAAGAPAAPVVEALRGFTKYPALMLTLERNGVHGVGPYSAAARSAAALEHDEESLAICQGLLALIDRARSSSTLDTSVAAPLISSLLEIGASGQGAGTRMAQWTRTTLLPALRNAMKATPRTAVEAESLVTRALAGPSAPSLPTIEWERRRYRVDLGTAEVGRLMRIRSAEGEVPLDRALTDVGSQAGLRNLAYSLAGFVYAAAIGDPDSPAVSGGPAWRRHRFRGEGPAAGADDTDWRIATESFGETGWRLTGSLLALEVALPRLALRRLDATDMPQPSRVSTSDRRALSLTIALIEPRRLTDDKQAAIAAALERGRQRARSLPSAPASLPDVARDAGLSEWRVNGIAWLLGTDPQRVPAAFSLMELYRLGRGPIGESAWGAAAMPLDGSLNLHIPGDPWEEYMGRPATGQLASVFPDVLLRTVEVLSELGLPACLGRDVASLAMQDVIDRSQPGYFDDLLSIAFVARDLERERFDDYIASLTASGPLIPIPKLTSDRQ
jgi:hypothetical protein